MDEAIRNKDMCSMVFGLRSWECTNTAFSSSILYPQYLKALYEKAKIRTEPQNFVLLLYGPVLSNDFYSEEETLCAIWIHTLRGILRS